MRPIYLGMLALSALLVASASARAGSLAGAMELEAARANARAGGPVSERDKELLERHGCLSGTNSDFCRKLERRDRVHTRSLPRARKRPRS